MIQSLFSVVKSCLGGTKTARTAKPGGSTLHIEFLEARYVFAGPPPVELDNWQSVIFDDGTSGTLPFYFSRNSPTVDPQGDVRGEGLPRYGDSRLLAEIGNWSQVLPSTGVAELFGSGWDHDGETPLAILYNANLRTLTFVRGDDFTIANTVTLNGNSDLLNGTVPGYRYRPQNAVIHDGLVVVMLQRDRQVGNGWVAEGISFAYTQDHGQTFQRVAQAGGGFDVPAIPGGVTDGMDRSRAWAFASAFPEQSVEDRLGAWFPWADYLQKSGNPKGGQIGLFRARRSEVGELWVVEPNVTVYETWRPDDAGGFHAHTAGMFVDGLASFWGDVSYRDRIVRHVAADMENYTTTTWTHQEDFQGGWSPDSNKVHVLGNQALSAVPGPEFGEILVAGDEQGEFIMKVERPEQAGGKAIVNNLRGMFPGPRQGPGYAGRTTSLMQYLPGVGYIAKEITSQVAGMDALYFSPDGENWGTLPNLSSSPYYLYGNKIIVTYQQSLFALDVPDDTAALSPLLLNSGGVNYAGSEWTQVAAGESGNTVRRVLYVDGVYVYQDNGQPLDVQPNTPPPINSGMPLYEMASDGTNDLMGTWELGTAPSPNGELHWLTAWHYSLDGNGVSPSIRIGNTPNTESEYVWVSNNEWVPTLHSGVASSPNGIQEIRVLNGSDPAPRRWLMGVQSFNTGPVPIYPAVPEFPAPHELAHVELRDITSSWSAALTFGLPQLSSFSTYYDASPNGTPHTLASFFLSNTEHIDVTFTKTTAAQGVLAMDVHSSGVLLDRVAFPSIYFDREDQIRLVISSSPEQLGITLLVTRNGHFIESKSIVGSATSIVPTQLRLSNATRTVVEPMEWFAIQFSPTQALTAAEREIMVGLDYMFERLDAVPVLGPPGFDDDNDFDGRDFLVWQRNYGMTQYAMRENGDANLDGKVDGEDLAVWQAGYGLGTVTGPISGDFNQDGAVDGQDLAAWQTNYGLFWVNNALSLGDSNSDGDIDGRDFLTWQRQYTGPASPEQSALTAAEEPTAQEVPKQAAETQATKTAITPTADEQDISTESAKYESPVADSVYGQFEKSFWLTLPPLAAWETKRDTSEKLLVENKIALDALLFEEEPAAANLQSQRAVYEERSLIRLESNATQSPDWTLDIDLAIETWERL